MGGHRVLYDEGCSVTRPEVLVRDPCPAGLLKQCDRSSHVRDAADCISPLHRTSLSFCSVWWFPTLREQMIRSYIVSTCIMHHMMLHVISHCTTAESRKLKHDCPPTPRPT